MPRVWAEFGSCFIPVLLPLGVSADDNETMVELPWTQNGEPAGPFRKGKLTVVPTETLIVCDHEPQRQLARDV